MNKNLNALQGEFEKLARTFSNKWDIRVDLTTLRCCTDGKTIFVPANADDLPQDSKQVLNGMLDHETWHAREEQKAQAAGQTTPLQVVGLCKNKTEKFMLNALEDIRIELDASREFVGISENLKVLNEHGLDLARKEPKKSFWLELGCAIIASIRLGDISWCSKEIQAILAKLDKEVQAAKNLTSATESLALARKIIAKVQEMKTQAEEQQEKQEQKKQQEKQEQSQGQAEGQDDEDGQQEQQQDGNGAQGEGDQDGEEGQDQDGEDQDGEEGEGQSSKSDSKDSEEDEQEQGSNKSGNGGDETGDKDLAKKLEGADQEPEVEDINDLARDQIAKQAQQEAAKGTRYLVSPAALKGDSIAEAYDDKQLDSYNRVKAQVNGECNVLKSKLLNTLKAVTTDRYIGDQEEGQLDGASLHSVKTGNERVFTRMVRGQSLDTAVTILIDISGSMGGNSENSGNGSYWAKRTAVVLAEALAALNIPFEVLGHTTRSVFNDGSNVGFTRTQAMVIKVYKAFDETFRSVRTRFNSINGDNENADCDAVMLAAKRLANRKEARKILITLTDGKPTASTNPALSQEQLREAVKRCSNAGIEVYGVGMGPDTYVEQYYNKTTKSSWTKITDMTKLAKGMLALLSEKLTNRRSA